MPVAEKHRRNPSLVALGRAIRAVRESQRVSQEDMAHRADVDRAYYGRVERGDNNVAVLTLAKIAKALGLSVAKLMMKAKL